MKRAFLCLLLAILVLISSSCGTSVSTKLYQQLNELVDEANAVMRREITFQMEASFSDPTGGSSGILYFLSGNGSYDRESKLAYQSYAATLLAASYTAEDYYKDGVRVHKESDETYSMDADMDQILSGFPYGIIEIPASEQLQSLSLADTVNGESYSAVTSLSSSELLSRWNLDLYTLAGITNPDYDKEKVGSTTYVIAVSNGKIVSVTIYLQVTIYEKSSYRPGYSSDADNRLDLQITAKVSYIDDGESVNVPTVDAVA